METFDEKQLLKAISEGDEKAFKTFFLYYYPRIKGFINRLLFILLRLRLLLRLPLILLCVNRRYLLLRGLLLR